MIENEKYLYLQQNYLWKSGYSRYKCDIRMKQEEKKNETDGPMNN